MPPKTPHVRIKKPGFLGKLKLVSKKRMNRQAQQERGNAVDNAGRSGSSSSADGLAGVASRIQESLTGTKPKRRQAIRPGEAEEHTLFDDRLPSPRDRVLELELFKLNESLGAWQKRKVVITNSVLAFGQVDDSGTAIATIPLWEISTVAPMHAFKEKEKDKKKLEKSNSGGSSHLHLLQEHLHSESLTRGPSMAPHGEVMGFDIVTNHDGPFSGKKFQFRAENRRQCQDVVERLNELVHIATKRYLAQTKFEQSQKYARDIFNGNIFQMISAFLIFTNFVFNVYQTQIQVDDGTPEARIFDNIDLAFTVVFTVELAVNAYGHWFKRFIRNGWSVFDAIVVSVSLIAAIAKDVPGISFLRLLRVFRVVRLFGRLEALRKIINALSRSIVPVLNSFVILLLVTCIYAMLAVNFFGERAPQDFGTFAQATLTLFILTSGEAWVENLPPFDEEGNVDAGVCIFMVSYILVVNWTLLQVSVAVLLDNFVSATAEEEHREHVRRQEENPTRSYTNPMEPVLRVLADHFDNDKDLTDRIGWIFDMVDEDRAGIVHKDQLRIGLNALPVEPHCHVLSEDVEQMMEDAGVEGNEVDKGGFSRILRQQVLEFVLRRVTDVANNHLHDDHIVAQMNSNKMILSMLARDSHSSSSSELREVRQLLEEQGRVARAQEKNILEIMCHLGLDPSAQGASDASTERQQQQQRGAPQRKPREVENENAFSSSLSSFTKTWQGMLPSLDANLAFGIPSSPLAHTTTIDLNAARASASPTGSSSSKGKGSKQRSRELNGGLANGNASPARASSKVSASGSVSPLLKGATRRQANKTNASASLNANTDMQSLFLPELESPHGARNDGFLPPGSPRQSGDNDPSGPVPGGSGADAGGGGGGGGEREEAAGIEVSESAGQRVLFATARSDEDRVFSDF